MQIQTEKIRGVIFDVDGTLYYHLPIRIIVIINLIVRNMFNPQYLLRVIKIITSYRKMQEKLRIVPLHDCALPDLQLQMTVQKTKESADFVREIIDEWMNRRPLPFLKYFIRPGLRRFIKTIKAHGLKLGVYSDYPCINKLEHMKIDDCFSAIVTSFDPEVLRFKPDTRGFLISSKKLGLKPDEILFIGDREKVDAAGAALSGMQVALVGGFLKTTSVSEKYPRYRSFNVIREELFNNASNFTLRTNQQKSKWKA